MHQLCNMKVHINGQHTFFLNEKIMSKYSGRLKKLIHRDKRRSPIDKLDIAIDRFPGGAEGFELVSRFCYNNGKITITVSNVSLLHCCAVHLSMIEKVSNCNLLHQTKKFLQGMFCWSLNDIITSLKSSERFHGYADSCGLLDNLVRALLAKIAHNSNMTTSSSSLSSPETSCANRFSYSNKTTPVTIKSSFPSEAWWFEDLSILPPKIIEKVIRSMMEYGTDNNSNVITRFLIHYLKTALQTMNGNALSSKSEYAGLAETAVYGVIAVDEKAFSCRRLFWILRIASAFGISTKCTIGLENLIGGMLDQTKLDDLLVSGHDNGVYDVNLVLRLIKVFVKCNDFEGASLQKLKKVGRLIDDYLCEISPDQNLELSKFLEVAESLPDSARDCFDRMYRAIAIYLESHRLSFEDTSKLCRCLNYGKLSLEVCKNLAKSPRIPPRIAMRALISQQSKTSTKAEDFKVESFTEEKEHMRLNLQKMQRRVVELEKLSREMKDQMSEVIGHNVVGVPSPTRPFHWICRDRLLLSPTSPRTR